MSGIYVVEGGFSSMQIDCCGRWPLLKMVCHHLAIAHMCNVFYFVLVSDCFLLIHLY